MIAPRQVFIVTVGVMNWSMESMIEAIAKGYEEAAKLAQETGAERVSFVITKQEFHAWTLSGGAG